MSTEIKAIEKNEEIKKEAKKGIKLVLAKKHPAKFYRLGKHKITNKADFYDLSKEEVKLLETKEFKHWIKKI